ncbi:MAG: ribonuclease R [Rhodocyclaceae bacterium]|nr:ribonuclease R [Rhodocyclaceae bacterium]MCL4682167.1 ribonuclease R [Rhodocyclaceae bacterium]
MLSNKTSKVRKRDPHYEREAGKYENPLPSREYVLSTLTERGVPLAFESLAGLLDIREHELDAFQRRLGAMQRDGQVMQNRRGDWLIPDKADLIRGRVEGHPDGYGFLVRDEEGPDLFLGPKEMDKALHGDRVMARIVGMDRRGRPEGKIVEVLERANHRVVGRVHNEHGVLFVVAENRRISQDILLAPGAKPKAVAGQVVVAEIIEQPSKHSQPIGKVVEVLGNYADPGMEIEIALRKHELPFEFSKEALAEAKKLPDAVRKGDWKWEGGVREDIRHLPLVTIDGETAKDFDDAVYCEREGKDGKGGFRLIVAIADVSHYVRAEQSLDRDAYERGNSVYFPRRVIPMLPEKISNGLCSLNPQVERLCMVCDMAIAANGVIKRYRFYPAVMYSHARLTYNQVAEALYGEKSVSAGRLEALLPHLKNLDALYRVLVKARWARGAIDFETVETQMIFDDQGKIARIVPVSRNDAHRIIEECMLAANVCASDFLHENEHAALYRIHEGPTPEKLEKLREFLKEFGLQLAGGDEPHAKDYAKLLEKVKDRPDMQLLQTVMLRSLQQAVYSPDNVGHFGLAYESYTHFTSPIRRYPDLLIHRAIKAVLQRTQYRPGKWDEIGIRCSQTERRADEATRDVESWLKCYYMQDRIGEEFAGSVSSATSFGIFVALDDVFVEGLVHISELGSDYFHYDSAKHQLVGERTGRRFRLSDRVRVQLVRVDMESSKIDFRLVEDEGAKGRRRG